MLEVDVAGEPPVESTDIHWSKGNNEFTIDNNKRIFPANSNKWLVVRNYTLEDSGTYHIAISRGRENQALASTHINFVVVGKYNSVIV